ncbi:MAG: HlyD family efflux transporter periplasmic adaptor subunit [Pseudomonadota bacterium]
MTLMIGNKKCRMACAAVSVAMIAATAPPAFGEDLTSYTIEASAAVEPVRGVARAKNEAVLSAGLKARVATINKRIGESFEAGDMLIEFDCKIQKADLAGARAAYRAARADYDTNVELKSFAAASDLEIKASRAEMEQAQARVEGVRAVLEQCGIAAPFAGRVSDQHIQEHETSAVDQPLLKIVGDKTIELHLIVPSHWTTWLTSGAAFTFEVDETGALVDAVVDRIGAEVDAVSKTILIIGAPAGNSEGLLPGMSGVANFDLPRG